MGTCGGGEGGATESGPDPAGLSGLSLCFEPRVSQDHQRGFVATLARASTACVNNYRQKPERPESPLVLGEGAVWLWRLADDRLPQARQRLDYCTMRCNAWRRGGRVLFGRDKDKFPPWLRPLVQQLKNPSAIQVILPWEEAMKSMPAGAMAAEVQKEVAYLQEHQDRMEDRAGARRGEPVGSGAMEWACRQAQGRFKRPGQDWSQQGDEALLCLETSWRNDRWHLLLPHNRHFDLSKNGDAHIRRAAK